MDEMKDMQELNDQELAQASGAGSDDGWVCGICGNTEYTWISKLATGGRGRPQIQRIRKCGHCKTETLA